MNYVSFIVILLHTHSHYIGRYSLWLREAESLIEESRDADSATDHNRALECSFEAQKLLEKILDAEDVPQKVVDVSYVKYEECSNLCRLCLFVYIVL